MGIRESINRRPAITFGVVAGVILVSLVFIFWPQGSAAHDSPAEAAYTTDDGKTWFADVGGRITPFMKDNQPAVGAILFSRDEGKTKFVGYLQRHDPAAVQNLSKPSATTLADLPSGEAVELGYRLQVKRPGTPAASWIRADSHEASSIIHVDTGKGLPGMPVDP